MLTASFEPRFRNPGAAKSAVPGTSNDYHQRTQAAGSWRIPVQPRLTRDCPADWTNPFPAQNRPLFIVGMIPMGLKATEGSLLNVE